MQICIETRLACRSQMPPVEKTAFYEEVAKKGRKYWDPEKIVPAKQELMELYRSPKNKMIGDQQVYLPSHPLSMAWLLPLSFLIILSAWSGVRRCAHLTDLLVETRGHATQMLGMGVL